MLLRTSSYVWLSVFCSVKISTFHFSDHTTCSQAKVVVPKALLSDRWMVNWGGRWFSTYYDNIRWLTRLSDVDTRCRQGSDVLHAASRVRTARATTLTCVNYSSSISMSFHTVIYSSATFIVVLTGKASRCPTFLKKYRVDSSVLDIVSLLSVRMFSEYSHFIL